MIETDAFFESNLEVIQREYMPKDGKRNTASVGQLLYEFFVFFLYEFDPLNEVISIKEYSSKDIDTIVSTGLNGVVKSLFKFAGPLEPPK